MEKYASMICRALSGNVADVHYAPTGSIYIKLQGLKVREIRLGNHNSQKLKRNVWQLRTDAMTHREKFNRTYNVLDVQKLISDILK